MLTFLFVLCLLGIPFVIMFFVVSSRRSGQVVPEKSDFQISFENRCIEAIRGKDYSLHDTIELNGIIEEATKISNSINMPLIDDEIL